MAFEQIAILALLGIQLAVFALDRFRIELVALTGLAIAFLLGLVPAREVFSGFANPAVITVVEILIIVHAIRRSRLLDVLAQRAGRFLRSPVAITAALCISGGVLSIFMNNVGALALLFPIALSLCEKADLPPSQVLMPLSFATLLGGLCSVIGTPANLIVSDALASATGQGLGFFTLGAAGGLALIAGLPWLIFAASRLLSHRRNEAARSDTGRERVIAAVMIARGSELAALSFDQIEKALAARIHSIERAGKLIFAHKPLSNAEAGDRLLLEISGEMLRSHIERGDLLIEAANSGPESDPVIMEASVFPESPVLGSRLTSLHDFRERGVAVIGVAGRQKRVEGRFGDLQLALGDILMLSGPPEAIRAVARENGLMILAERTSLPTTPRAYLPVGIFAIAVIAAATGLARPEIAFGGAIIVLTAIGALPLREALREMNWPVILMLAAMIPLGIALETTGTASLIATGMVDLVNPRSDLMVCALVLAAGVILTPFVNNASTAVLLAPIAIEISARTGAPLEALLVCVAMGASLDFLTPFGHHNNAIVMGAAGYRFNDYPRFGAPLLIFASLAVLAGVWLFWL
ncbi:MAG: SLC13 family permease [Glycocaulis sp.]